MYFILLDLCWNIKIINSLIPLSHMCVSSVTSVTSKLILHFLPWICMNLMGSARYKNMFYMIYAAYTQLMFILQSSHSNPFVYQLASDNQPLILWSFSPVFVLLATFLQNFYKLCQTKNYFLIFTLYDMLFRLIIIINLWHCHLSTKLQYFRLASLINCFGI